ncbi:right-handed parallel beta-helix repeat-containing protein, partial [Streptomyces sp. 2MCAF27]
MTPTHSARRAGRGRLLGPLVAVALGAFPLLGPPATARADDPPGGTTYYVDSRAGNDSASGTS